MVKKVAKKPVKKKAPVKKKITYATLEQLTWLHDRVDEMDRQIDKLFVFISQTDKVISGLIEVINKSKSTTQISSLDF